ncbi:MAG: hypothetical protein AAGA60_23980 [Cyanobacteria bacterium P01_E01_bin.42]
MNLKELRLYVLAHRENDTAFYTYVDRLHQEAKWVKNPPIESSEDLENYPEFLERLENDSGKRR